jgi:hypothetical protein
MAEAMTKQRDYTTESDEKACALVREFSNWVNGMGHDNHAFVQAVMLEHRTIQQQMFEVMLSCMQAWSQAQQFDLRNEFTVVKSREIMALFPGGPRAPFI